MSEVNNKKTNASAITASAITASAITASAITIEEKREVAKRLSDARMRIMYKMPFYGNLLLHMNFGVALCGTAATDMKKIIFDPNFTKRLSDAELDFVLLHEIMHCALQHCIRGKNLNQLVFNIACDIVVNSNIMQSMGITTFQVDGEEPMHIAPNGIEGYEYTAEQIYELLMTKAQNNKRKSGNSKKQMIGIGEDDSGVKAGSEKNKGLEKNKGSEKKRGQKKEKGAGEDEDQNKEQDDEEDIDNNPVSSLLEEYGEGVDDHRIWDTMEDDPYISDQWKNNVAAAAAAASGGNGQVPPGARKLMADMNEKYNINWKEILHDFICMISDKYDFLFTPPDRRFQDSSFILPAFSEIQEEMVKNLWFVVDTSGSISNKMLTMTFNEIKAALQQFTQLTGKISFFDTFVSRPQDFDSLETLENIEAVGGGGTSFINIFRYMKKHMSEDFVAESEVMEESDDYDDKEDKDDKDDYRSELPVAVIILTDGYAIYPRESDALGVPVLWILQDNEADAPWGTSIHVSSERL